MTAGELIEILERWPADAPVKIMVRDRSLYREILEVWRSSLTTAPDHGPIILEG